MRSIPEFLLIAMVVTVTPGPGTANVVTVATRAGRSAARRAIVGNSVGVLAWGVLAAVGVSSLILASKIAYAALRLGGASVLLILGIRSLVRPGDEPTAGEYPRSRKAGWQAGLLTSLSNPKLAVFFVAIFPQFLVRNAPVLPYALAIAAVIVALDVVWFTALTYAVDRARQALEPQIQRRFERVTGAIMVALAARLVTER
jgi:threonine/homoserine/homoserine lactone efflux protein